MKKAKRARLEKAGWKLGTAAEFLGLSDEDAMYVELRLALSEAVKQHRQKAGLSQGALANRLGSSQSRVSKIESADPTVSLDLMVRSLFAAGASRADVAAAIAKPQRRKRQVA
jgi:ribosome-binding protein aMBF1 (putative translation factor)